MYEELVQNLFDLILNAEEVEPSIRKFYEKLQPNIRPLADWLHIARIDVRVVVEPSVYEMNGKVDTFTNFYHEEAGDRDSAMVVEYPLLSHTNGIATFFPWKGYVWSEKEREQIVAVSKMVNILLSRCNMVRYQEEAPYVDLLTGLANTRGIARFDEQIGKGLRMAEYAGCFINLRNFKYINQQLTQPLGDKALQKYATQLYSFVDPRKELMARLGGDNFFAFVRKSHLEEFLTLVTSSWVTVPAQNGDKAVTITARVGVYPAKDGDTVEQALRYSGFALERAKRTHLLLAYFDPSQMEESLHMRKVAQTIPQALENGEFIPLYQPKIRASNGGLYGCEALARWQREGKIVPPSAFIPAAEDSGLIRFLDQYILERVCRDIRSWLDAGIEPVCVSVNFSQADFYDENLIKNTLEIINRYDIDGKYLEIEITESCFHENYVALQDFVTAMHENGIRVSLDDFGTGYSSLTMFKNLNLDIIKLDKSFFDDLTGSNEADRVILRTVAGMIHELKKLSISEGVETSSQLDFAKEIGCDIIQGFYFDRPLDYEDFTQRLLVRHYDEFGKPAPVEG